jgi:primosomal protein N'
MFARIILFNQSFDDVGFTYEVPHFLDCKIGHIVEVPFGKKQDF